MSDQPKLVRALNLMMLMSSNVHYTLDELGNRIGLTSRSVRRYMDSFREAGFVVEKEGEYHRLDICSSEFKEISELLHFSKEESYILKSAIESVDGTNPLKQNLKKKLYSVCKQKIPVQTLVKGKLGRVAEALIQAIENRNQVVLRDYGSAHSGNVSDRVIEPFAFTTNYIEVWAYEPASGMNKLFKLARIDRVEVLNLSWEHDALHEEGFMDIFRMHSSQRFPIKLLLNRRAFSLLQEEYPLSEEYIKQVAENEWMLETEVCCFDGVGRFVLGLCEDVEVMESEAFREFLKTKQMLSIRKW